MSLGSVGINQDGSDTLQEGVTLSRLVARHLTYSAFFNIFTNIHNIHFFIEESILSVFWTFFCFDVRLVSLMNLLNILNVIELRSWEERGLYSKLSRRRLQLILISTKRKLLYIELRSSSVVQASTEFLHRTCYLNLPSRAYTKPDTQRCWWGFGTLGS